ncbi:MAG TPA: DUF423 domain-containing protein [Longimicrobiales bacterium]|nr:DUF423 domain-containing protein [Longimicrobiales bacterium]
MRHFIVIGAVLAAAAVAAGAFGAHALASRLSPDRLSTWETAARYHMYHGLALVLVAAVGDRLQLPLAGAAAWLILIGVVIFAGTVYVLALGGPRWLGAVTPVGGLALIAGWLVFAWAVAGGHGALDP